MRSDSPASQTALMVAAYRARASSRSDAFIRDPWAAALAGDDGLAISRRFDASWEHMELWIALRTAHLDAQIERFVAGEGFGQVVILGAGFDTRSARMARPGVRFFEVDHPATQDDKRRRLADLPGYPVESAIYAACDFERDDFLDRLVAAGFDVGAPAVVVWEGVVPYLTEDAIRATATRVASGCEARTVLVFDGVRKRMVDGDRLRDQDRRAVELVGELGEPIRFGTDDPLPLLYQCGFRHVRTVSFDEICLSVTGSYVRERAFRFQSITLASRTARLP